MGKLEEHYASVSFVCEKREKAIKLMIEDFIDLHKIDLVLLGSVELSNLNGQQLGSVSEGVAKRSAAHTCIVKNFAYTW